MITIILAHLGSALVAGWIGWQVAKHLPVEKI